MPLLLNLERARFALRRWVRKKGFGRRIDRKAFLDELQRRKKKNWRKRRRNLGDVRK
jgi:hypothetical protein